MVERNCPSLVMQALVLFLICFSCVLAQQWDVLYDTTFEVNPGNNWSNLKVSDGLGTTITQYSQICEGSTVVGIPLYGGRGHKLIWSMPTLTPFTKISVSFTIWTLEDWEKESVRLTANGVNLWSSSFTKPPTSSTCGSIFASDLSTEVDVSSTPNQIPLNGNVLTLVFTSNQWKDWATFGISALKISILRPTPPKKLFQTLLSTEFDRGVSDGFTTNPGYKINFLKCSKDNVIGQLGRGGQLIWTKTFANAWREASISFKYAYLDTWQNQKAILFVNGIPVWEKQHKSRGRKSICADPAGPDSIEQVSFNINLQDQKEVTIVFTSTLNGLPNAQSFGISSVLLSAFPTPRVSAALGDQSVDAQDSATGEAKASGLAPLHIGLIVAGAVVLVVVVVVLVVVVVKNRQSSVDLDYHPYELQEDE